VLGGGAGTGGSGLAPAVARPASPAQGQAPPADGNGQESGGSDPGTQFAPSGTSGSTLSPWNQVLNSAGGTLLTPGQQGGFVPSTAQSGSSPTTSSTANGGTGAVTQLPDPAANVTALAQQGQSNGTDGSQQSAADTAVRDDVFSQVALSNGL
jgi:hypothetical protein